MAPYCSCGMIYRKTFKITCTTQLPLGTWSKLYELDCHPDLDLDRFSKPLRRLSRFQHAVESFKQSQILENPTRTHLIEPCWANDEQCVHCRKRLHCSTVPANLSRKCPAATEIPLELLGSWHSEFDSMINVKS